MNTKKMALVVLLSIITAQATELPNQLSKDPQNLKVFDPLFDDPELDRFINPDPQEEEFVYSIEQPPPPGKLIIWLRIIGMPIVNAFFSVRRVVRESIAWILAKIKNDQEKNAHAQN